jgi:hypothetical protein
LLDVITDMHMLLKSWDMLARSARFNTISVWTLTTCNVVIDLLLAFIERVINFINAMKKETKLLYSIFFSYDRSHMQGWRLQLEERLITCGITAMLWFSSWYKYAAQRVPCPNFLTLTMFNNILSWKLDLRTAHDLTKFLNMFIQILNSTSTKDCFSNAKKKGVLHHRFTCSSL